MAFTDHKINAFTHKIADLADQPNMPPDELKARFDSSPEQLRQAHNAVCDEAARLDERVSGIIAGAFGDTIDKSMLSPELAAEIDATVTQGELESAVDTLESADSALSTRLSSAESTLSAQTTQIAQKCQVYVGTYTGDGAESQFINLGFTPKAVLVLEDGTQNYSYINGCNYYHGGLAVQNAPAMGYTLNVVAIVNNGFQVYTGALPDNYTYIRTNNEGQLFHYIALR